jgi:hypothetical protein
VVLIIEYKTCSKCEITYPKTDEYFYKQKSKKCKDGYYLSSECKNCRIKAALKWKKDNPEKNREYSRIVDMREDKKIRKRNVSKERRLNGKHKKYIQNNPDKTKEYNRRHQLKKHKISKQEWNACKEYFNNSCCYCGITYEEHKIKYNEDLHKEHYIDDGANDLSNCVPACKSCNSQKWEFDVNEWFNEDNPRFTKERYKKILKWINEDYKKYIKEKKKKLVS